MTWNTCLCWRSWCVLLRKFLVSPKSFCQNNLTNNWHNWCYLTIMALNNRWHVKLRVFYVNIKFVNNHVNTCIIVVKYYEVWEKELKFPVSFIKMIFLKLFITRFRVKLQLTRILYLVVHEDVYTSYSWLCRKIHNSRYCQEWTIKSSPLQFLF